MFGIIFGCGPFDAKVIEWSGVSVSVSDWRGYEFDSWIGGIQAGMSNIVSTRFVVKPEGGLITLHYIISQRRLYLKWPVVHQQSHIRHS